MTSKNLWFVVLIFGVLGFGVTANAQEPDQKLEEIIELTVSAAVLAFQNGMNDHIPHKIWFDQNFVEAEVRPRWEKLVRAVLVEKTLVLNSKEYWSRCRSIGMKLAELAMEKISGKKTVAKS